MRWVELRTEMLTPPDGVAVKRLGTAADVTERGQVEDELEASELRFESGFQHSPIGIALASLDGRYLRVNPALCQMLGRDEATLMGMRFQDLTHPDDVAVGLAEVRKMADGKTEVFQAEKRYLRPDGTVVWAQLHSSVVRDGFGNASYLFSQVQDITEKKHAQDDLAALRADLERRVEERSAEAERANQAKSEFLSRMSHELRTPLNGILGFAQLLSMDELGVDQAQSVRHILTGGRHLLELINEVLDLARIESGQLAMSIEPVPLSAVLDEALDLLRPQAAEHGVSLPAGSPVPTDVHVSADQQRLLQIFLNLMSNAVKYNVDGGSVTLDHEERPGGRLRVSITDTGPGIAFEDIERIFLPFERLSVAGAAVEGTGLGLAVSKRLAETMGAGIGLTNAPDQGSTFWVELILAQCWNVVSVCPDRTSWSPDGVIPEATVLYIEDNPSNVHLVEALIQRLSGVRLLAARTGQVGLELANQRQPDLILLDLDLPDLSGAEVLSTLRADANTAAIPVVVVSADATDAQVRRLLGAGAKSYLTKPLDVQLFFAVVEKALRGRTTATGDEPAVAVAKTAGKVS